MKLKKKLKSSHICSCPHTTVVLTVSQISFCKIMRGPKGGLAKVDDKVEILFTGDKT